MSKNPRAQRNNYDRVLTLSVAFVILFSSLFFLPLQTAFAAFEYSVTASTNNVAVRKTYTSQAITITVTGSAANPILECSDVRLDYTWEGADPNAIVTFPNGNTADDVWRDSNSWSTNVYIQTSQQTSIGDFTLRITGVPIGGCIVVTSPPSTIPSIDAIAPVAPPTVFSPVNCDSDPHCEDISVKITNEFNIYYVDTKPPGTLGVISGSSSSVEVNVNADPYNSYSANVKLEAGPWQPVPVNNTLSYSIDNSPRDIDPGQSFSETLKVQADSSVIPGSYVLPIRLYELYDQVCVALPCPPVWYPVNGAETSIVVAPISLTLEMAVNADEISIMQGSSQTDISALFSADVISETGLDYRGPFSIEPISYNWIGDQPKGIWVTQTSDDLTIYEGEPESVEFTITADPDSDIGDYSLRILGEVRGEDGDIITSADDNVDVHIEKSPFSFSVKPSPVSLTIEQNSAESSTISVTALPSNEVPIQMDLTVQWIGNHPSASSETTLSLGDFTLDPSQTVDSRLAIQLDKSALVGSYVVRVTAVGTSPGLGVLTQRVDIPVTVTTHVSSFVLLSDPAEMSVSPGESASTILTITADPANFVPIDVQLSADWTSDSPSQAGLIYFLESTSIIDLKPGEQRTVSLKVNAFGTANIGSYQLMISAQGTDGSPQILPSRQLSLPVTVSQFDFRIEANKSDLTISPGEKAEIGIDVDLVKGVSQTVTLSAEGKENSQFSDDELVFETSSGKPAFSTKLTIVTNEDMAHGAYQIVITGKSGGVSHAVPITVNILAFDFGVELSEDSSTIVPGQRVDLGVDVLLKGGEARPVTLSLDVEPMEGAGSSLSSGDIDELISAEFSQNSLVLPYSSTLTLTTDPSLPIGSYKMTVHAIAGEQQIIRSASHQLIVVSAFSIIVDGDPRQDGILFVDGVELGSEELPKTFFWLPGEVHTIKALDHNPLDEGTRYSFSSWNDDTKSPERTFTVNGPDRLTASYDKEYQLEIISSYGSPQGSGWYKADEVAVVSVKPENRDIFGIQIFQGWRLGSETEIKSPETRVLMNGPKMIVAEWNSSISPEAIVISAVGVPSAVIASWIASLHFKAPWAGVPLLSCKVFAARRIRKMGTSYIDVDVHNIGVSAADKITISITTPRGIDCIEPSPEDQPIVIKKLLSRESKKFQIRIKHNDVSAVDRTQYHLDIVVKCKAKIFFVIPLPQKFHKQIGIEVCDLNVSLVGANGGMRVT